MVINHGYPFDQNWFNSVEIATVKLKSHENVAPFTILGDV